MHIFEIIPELNEGGAERFVVDLSNSLVEHCNCQVTLIVFFYVDRDHKCYKDLSSKVRFINFNKKLGLDFSIIVKLFKLVKEFKPDVIHTHLNAFEYSFFNSFYFRNRIKIINTLHSSPERMYQKKRLRFIGNLLYRFAGVKPVIISSDSIAEFNQLFPGLNPIVIFNGRPVVDLSQKYTLVIKEIESYKKSPETKVFITLARISPVKNQLMLVDAFNKLIDERKDIILLIVGALGDSEIADEIKRRATDGVYLLGYKDNPIDYLACSNAFCLSSLKEGMPLSLIESIQRGIVPICTPAGGVKDIISPSIGFISKDFSTDSYIESIKSFLALNPSEIEKMGVNGKKKYEDNYTMEVTALKYIQLYNN
jgi:glycosyltransferase involved in cell wall biosynthesis